MSGLKLDVLGPEDVAGLVELTRRVRWVYTAADAAALVAAGRFFGHRAPDGDLVSSAALFPYGDAMATVGMVIVSPDWQRRGLGRVLVEKCLEAWPHDDRPVALIATVEGEPLYSTLGFKTVEHIRKMMGKSPWQPGDGAVLAGGRIRPMDRADHAAVRHLDRRAIGADRERVLTAKLDQAETSAVVLGADGSVTGYGLRVAQPEQSVVGPIVAPDDAAAAALVDRLCAGYQGPVRIDLPDFQDGFRAKLETRGFEQVDRPPVMVKGGSGLPGERQLWFAIVGQAFG